MEPEDLREVGERYKPPEKDGRSDGRKHARSDGAKVRAETADQRSCHAVTRE